MKKILSMLIFFLILFSILIIPMVNSENISLWPAKLNINISSYPDDEIKFNKIQINNPYNEEITVIPQVINPPEDVRNASFLLIPDLSWVKVSPEELIIPAKSSGFFELTVNIPEDKRSDSYGEKWEVWVRVYKKIDPESKGVIINVMPSSKIFIHNPIEKSDVDLNPYIFWFSFVGLFLIVFLYVLIRILKSRSVKSVYYFKKKKK